MKIFGFNISRATSQPAEKLEARAEKELVKRRAQFSESMREKLNALGTSFDRQQKSHPVPNSFPTERYTPPPKVCPASHVLAMDSTVADLYSSGSAIFFSGIGFPGFPYLTELSQLTEYRDMTERTTAEMVRKWVKIRSSSEDDKSDHIKAIEAEMSRLKVRDHFRRAAELDGYMGRSQIFIDLGEDRGPELEMPLLLSKAKIKKGALRGFKVIEPVTTYPCQYSCENPLAQDYFQPSLWYVYGQKVHTTRLLPFVSRPVPDLLKPTYNFSGMSLSQLARPYVEYWLNTRNSVGNLLRNFSITALKTNMQDALSGGTGDTLLTRAKMFTQFRDNQGLFLLDNDASSPEDLVQINTPLSGLDKLQAQAQEHMAAVAKTPLVVLLGITPSGLSASSEGEIRVFYDYVADQQEKLFRTPLDKVIKIIQLHLFGEIDESITFDFVSLFAMSDKELSMIRKSDADCDQIYTSLGAVSPEEVRARVASDPMSGYNNLDLDNPLGELATPESEEEPNSIDAADSKAVILMMDAQFYGNRHTGKFGVNTDHPYLVAERMSNAAQKATSVAKRAGSRTAHEAALKAHSRALAAHQHALQSAATDVAPTHNAYVAAHEAGIECHKEFCK